MNLTNISKFTPIEPEIEVDGGYAYCVRCGAEVTIDNNICPECGQVQDWSWYTKHEKYEEKFI